MPFEDALAIVAGAPRKRGTRNNAGGAGTFAVSDMQRLQRFLILGVEGGTYYQKAPELALENATALTRLLVAGKGAEVVAAIVGVSTEGRAAKQGPTMFAFAMCARLGDVETRRLCYASLTKVCRIPTHLFQFISMAQELGEGSGWGRLQRKAVSEFYNDKTPSVLAFAVTKYKNREGFTHRDVLRLAHVKPATAGTAAVLKYAAKGWGEDAGAAVRAALLDGAEGGAEEGAKAVALLAAVEEAKTADEARLLELIAAHRLAREHVPSEHLNATAVWEALLRSMPMTAMLRNLAKMTAIGVLAPLTEHAGAVCAQLGDAEALRKARVHPFSVLLAMKQYEQGRGDKGSLVWDPNQQIVAALDGAFYASFKNVQPTGKRFLLGMDVSGSMDWGSVNGASCLTPRIAAAAMAMVTMRTEPVCHTVAFTDEIVPLQIHARMSLGEVINTCSRLPFGATNCAQPMLHALAHGLKVDIFIVYTDCETWAGNITPYQALVQYRRKTGIAAKLIVVAMTSGGFTIADPDDDGMLDVVGFDSACPEIIRAFAEGSI
jgi:60 kDa SS-A/Ro ribonucleoprotein